MEALLGLIIALLLFASFILMISRSVRILLFLGIAVVVFMILTTIGLLG